MEYKELLSKISELSKVCHENFTDKPKDFLGWYVAGRLLEDLEKTIKEVFECHAVHKR